MNELAILNINGVECFEKDGTAYLKLETVARGLGFTQEKNGVEYVRWETVDRYLKEIGFPNKLGNELNFATSGERPEYIPENVFYRLAMKAKNEAAEAFQAKIADEVIPSIRKHGGYLAGQEAMSPEELMASALLMAQKTIEARDARISALTVQNQIMAPKAEYFDAIVDRNLLTNFRETAKQLGVGEKVFIRFLLDQKFIYRDQKGKLQPYAEKNTGLFELKECLNEKTGWGGVQTLITPKGRETFRLLTMGLQ